MLYRRDDGQIGTIVSPELVELNEEYARNWSHLDVRAEHGFRAFANGSRDVQADHTFFTDDQVAKLPIFQEFLHPRGFGWGMGAFVSPMPSAVVILSLVRAKDKPGFNDEEQEQMLAISQHVERALSLSIRLIDAEAERIGLSEALDHFDCGVLILAPDRRVLLKNRTASRFLGEGLNVKDGRLRASDNRFDSLIQKKIDDSKNLHSPGGDAQASLVVSSGPRGLILKFLPLLLPIGLPALQTAQVIVLISDVSSHRPFDPAVVRDAFRLTLGEARLAALVGAGDAPIDAAATLGISEHTARTVLKRVFEKIGVSRQSELAALMGKLFMLRQEMSGEQNRS